MSDISDDEVEARCVNAWTYVTDPFSDHHKTSLRDFQGGVEISPAVLLSNAKIIFVDHQCIDHFEIFFEKVVPCLCEWTNEKADIYFEDINYKIKILHGLK